MPRKTSFCNAALLRSDIKRYWPLLFLYVAVWVVILPMQILSASRQCDGVADGIMTVLQLRQHNVIIQSIPASAVMSLLFGCFAAMAVWSYLMSGRTVGLMHALPVTRTQAFFSHILSVLGALTAGNVLIFLLTALCSAGFSYVDWTALGTWLLLTELMALFFFALGSLCAMVTGWLLAVPVLYGAMNVVALLLYAVISTMTQMFYFGYSSSDIPEFITWLTPVGRIWDAVANGGAQPVEVQLPIGAQIYHRFQLPASAFSTCIIYAAVGIALLALVWWLYKKRPSETAGDAMSFRWLQPIARWSIGLCGGWGLGLFLNYVMLGSSSFAGLLICQLVMGVICFFAAQMLLKKKFRIFTRRWWVETVVLLSHKKADSYIHIDVEFGEGEGKIPVDSIAKRAEAYKPKEKVTYKMIKEYIEAKYGFKVHTAYIAEVKRNLGLPMYDAPNAVEELKQPRKHPTPEKVEAIKDALRYFAVI